MKKIISKIIFFAKFTGAMLAAIAPIVLFVFLPTETAFAAFNNQINYQGRLTNSSGVAVTNGNYNIQFKIYTTATGGSPIWTETECYSPDNGTTCNGTGTDNRVAITNGLFSVMLGSSTPFTNVNFNQTLYLGVNIGSTGTTPSYDGEMSPRKILGAVPAAMYAGTSTVATTLNGKTDSQFFRNDQQNSTSTGSTFLNILQSGAGKIAEFFGSATQSVLALLSNGNVGIGSSTPSSVLAVQGSSSAPTTNLFTVAESNGSTTFNIAPNGAAAIGTTTSAAALSIRPLTSGTYPIDIYSYAGNPILHAALNGNLGEFTTNPQAALDISDGTSQPQIEVGADLNNSTRTNGVQKVGRIAGATYNPSDAPVGMIGINSQSNFNNVKIGGGFGTVSAATQIDFFIATTSNVANGTSAVTINNVGNVLVNTGNLLLTSGVLTVSTTTGVSTFAGPVTVSGKTTLGTASSTGLTVTATSTLTGARLTNLASAVLAVDANGNVVATSTASFGTNFFTNSAATTTLSTGSILAAGTGTFGTINATSTTGTSTIVNSLQVDSGTFTVNAVSNEVGVNTLNPTAALFVTGTAGVNPFAVASSTGASLLSIMQNGNLGIGTSTPLKRLTIVDTANGQNLWIESAANNTGMVLNNTQAGGRQFEIDSSGGSAVTPSSFYINDISSTSIRFLIGPTGNIGIGSSTPGSLLSVQGNAYFGGNVTATGTLTVSGKTTLATASSTGLTVTATSTLTGVKITNLASAVLAVDSSGNVIATTTSGGGINFFSNASATTSLSTGSILAAGTGTFGVINSTSTTGINSIASTLNISTDNIPLIIQTGNTEVAQYIGSAAYAGFRVASVGTGIPYVALNTGASGLGTGAQQAYFAYNLSSPNFISLGYGGSNDAIGFTGSSGTDPGSVGIGTGFPSARLDVQGTSASPSEDLLDVASSTGVNYFTVASTGNVGIGSSTPGSLLAVQGSAYFGGNVTATGTLTVSATSTLSGVKLTNLSNTVLAVDSAGNVIATTTSGGGTNFFANSGATTTLSTGSILMAAVFNATSTTATSTFALADVTKLLQIGTNSVGSTTLTQGTHGGLNVAGNFFDDGGERPIVSFSAANKNNFTYAQLGMQNDSGTNYAGTLNLIGQANSAYQNLDGIQIYNGAIGGDNRALVIRTKDPCGTGTDCGAYTLFENRYNPSSLDQNTTYANFLSANQNGNVGIGDLQECSDDTSCMYLVPAKVTVYGGANNIEPAFEVYPLGAGTAQSMFTVTSLGQEPTVGVGTSTPTATFQVQAYTTGAFAEPTRTFDVVATSGVDYFNVQSNGNVGIGTTTPGSLLAVQGSAYFGGNVTATGTLTVSATSTLSGIRLTNLTKTFLAVDANGNVIATSTAGLGTNFFSNSSASTSLTTGSNLLAGIGTFGTVIATSTTGTSTFANAATFIGNVGVGTTSLANAFTVNGNTLIHDYLSVAPDYGTNNRLDVGKTTIAGGCGGVTTGFINVCARGGATYTTALSALVESNAAQGIELWMNNGSGIAMNNGVAVERGFDGGVSPAVGSGAGYIMRLINPTGAAQEDAVALYDPLSATSSTHNTNDFQVKVNNAGTMTERLRILGANGNVGIGSSTPGSLLSVQGNAYFGGNVTATGTLTVLSSTGTSTFTNSATFGGLVGIGTTTQIYPLEIDNNTGGVSAGEHIIAALRNPAGGGAITGYQADGSNVDYGFVRGSGNFGLDLGVAGDNNAISIAYPSGNVGIGSSTPNSQLSVGSFINIFSGGAAATGTATIRSSGSNIVISPGGSAGTTYLDYDSGSAGNGTYFGNGAQSIVAVMNTAGSLGLGTTTASQQLTVGNGGALINRNGSDPFVQFAGTGTAETQLRGISGGGFRVTDGNAVNEWMRITSGGLFGIGSSTPSATFAVNAATNSVPLAIASSSGKSLLLVNSSGFVGISTSTPGSALDVAGNITDENVKACSSATNALGTTATGTIICNVSVSDERLKNDITSLNGQDALNLIDSLNPVSYYWKDPTLPGTNSTAEQFGFIAQQVNQVAPNLVGTTTPTYLTPDQTYYLNYQGIISPLVKAVQQQQIEILAASSTLSSTTVSVNANAVTLTSLSTQVGSLVAQINASVASTTQLAAAVASLTSSTAANEASLQAQINNLASTTASTTATTAALSSSSSFIQTIANAVIAILNSGGQVIQSTGDWVVGKLSATTVITNDVQTQTLEAQAITTQSINAQTANVAEGLEMKDQATGYIYCIRLIGGQFEKTLGTCASAASTTPSLMTNPVTTVDTVPMPAPDQDENQGQTQTQTVSTGDDNASSTSDASTTATTSSAASSTSVTSTDGGAASSAASTTTDTSANGAVSSSTPVSVSTGTASTNDQSVDQSAQASSTTGQ